MLSRIRVLAERSGKTVLISIHIVPDVQSLCDSVVILAGGPMRVSGRLEVLSRPASPTYHLRVVGDGTRLVDRLRDQGIAVPVEDDRSLTLVGVDAATGRAAMNER